MFCALAGSIGTTNATQNANKPILLTIKVLNPPSLEGCPLRSGGVGRAPLYRQLNSQTNYRAETLKLKHFAEFRYYWPSNIAGSFRETSNKEIPKRYNHRIKWDGSRLF
jgi:hypothetical protein